MRNRNPATLAILLLAIFALAPIVRAEDAPAGRGPMIQRLESRLKALDLTDDQQHQIDQILDDATRKLNALRKDADLAKLREASAEVFRDVRSRLAGVLTAAQLRQLEQSMPTRPREPSDAPPKPESPPTTEGGMTEMKGEGMTQMNEGGAMMGESKPPTKTPEKSPATPAPTDTSASLIDERFKPGADAPAFTIKTTDGKPVSLSRYRGKPTVILFGSFTSPTFRDKAPVFDAMRKDYRNKANFIVVYTREAYPNNEWEVQRNIEDQIRVGQHTTIEERTRLAKLTAEGMKLEMDVLVDEMDDGVAKAYDAMPNGCVVLDAQGKIVRKQKWADAYGAKLALDEALRTR